MLKKKFILILFWVISSQAIQAQQFAVIQDKDGYTNLRSEATIRSSVLQRIYDFEPFFYYEQLEEDIENWLFINASITPYSDISKEVDQYQNGYIYRSRVKFVNTFDEIAKKIASNKSVKLYNDSLSIRIKKRKFDTKKHQIEYFNAGKFVKSIDSETLLWGTDGNIPEWEISEFSIKLNGEVVDVPLRAYQFIYEPNLESVEVFIDNDNHTFYIIMSGSDGAGSYRSCLTFHNHKYHRRWIGHPF